MAMLSKEAQEMRTKILAGLREKFTIAKLSKRKNKDGSLAYQDFIDKASKKEKK